MTCHPPQLYYFLKIGAARKPLLNKLGASLTFFLILLFLNKNHAFICVSLNNFLIYI
jgi:hypothetical protein